MRVAIGADHGGFEAKEALKGWLLEQGHELEDFGTLSPERCDYPDIASKLAQAVASGHHDRGVLVCGTGQGMAISANKVKGIRAGAVVDEFSAKMIAEHNQANVICLGARISSVPAMQRLIEVYFKTNFGGGRHAQRVAKINALQ